MTAIFQSSPLRPQAESSGPQSPEALFISALLDTGEFVPARHRLDVGDLACLERLWHFCCDHQDKTGQAPALELVSRRFPEFEHTPNVRVEWAAEKLREASFARTMRSTISEAIALLGDEDVEQAVARISTLKMPAKAKRTALGLFDTSTYSEEALQAKMPVPYDSLGRYTGGIGPGELWYLIARQGHGKTWELCHYAARAALEGYRVTYLSLEMKARGINRRIHRYLAGRDKVLLAALGSPLEHERAAAVAQLQERLPGRVDTLDPGHAMMNTALVREVMEGSDLVVVDHVGLLHHGRERAITDWRVFATISNVIREHALSTGVPVLGAVQANREAETGTKAPPKLSQAGGTDALGQDADVAIAMRRLSEHVRVHQLVKNREGEEVRWWTQFDPARGLYGEITREKAETLGAIDEDARESLR